MKRWKIGIIVVVCVVLLLNLFGFARKPILPIGIKKIELHTYSHTGLRGRLEAELNWSDALKIVALYNFSRYEREINAEPCCASCWVEVYLMSGKVIRIEEGTKNKVIVQKGEGKRYYMCNDALVDYILQLAEKYELVYD